MLKFSLTKVRHWSLVSVIMCDTGYSHWAYSIKYTFTFVQKFPLYLTACHCYNRKTSRMTYTEKICRE